MKINHQEIGIGIVGCGRMGNLRTSISKTHGSVKYISLSDTIREKAEELGEKVNADRVCRTNQEVIDDKNTHAIIVSTSEPEHCNPVIKALENGKPVLVEKPIALNLNDAQKMVDAAKRNNTSLHVGYTMRFNRHFLIGKQQINENKVGNIISCVGRFYNTQRTGAEILKRSKHISFVNDALTYLVDLFGWYLGNKKPKEIIAKGHGTIYRKDGFDVDEIAAAIITYDDGTIVNLAMGYALPKNYPSHGRLVRAEIIGESGVLLFDDDRKEHIGFSDEGMHHAYVDNHTEMALLTSNASGNWALNKYWGPFADETRSWLDFISQGIDCPNTTGIEGLQNLRLTLAIEDSIKLDKKIRIED
jgi:predicted dehydrogenase